jgi:DMSO/TMAO reductase YedYZ molybdopterin-dependent catalytic subunit
MKKLAFAILMVFVLIALVGCQSTSTQEAAPTETIAPAESTGTAALTITGLVDTEKSFTMDELKAMTVVQETVEHPKKGSMDVSGVNLNSLLDLAGVKADATKLILTASDGFTSEVDLATVRSCADCLVMFADDGTLGTAMPGFEGKAWAKMLVKIEMQ